MPATKIDETDDVITRGSSPINKLTSLLKAITVEPVVFFYALGFSITMVISPNLYLEKTCTVRWIFIL